MTNLQGNGPNTDTANHNSIEVFYVNQETRIQVTEKLITYFRGEPKSIDILNIKKVHSFSDPGFAIYALGFSALGVLVFGIWGLLSWQADIGILFLASAAITFASFCIVNEFLIRITLYVGGKVLIPVAENEVNFFHSRINQLANVNKIAAAITDAKAKAPAIAKSRCS